MNDEMKKNSTLQLTYIGEDDWACPTFRDQFNRLWKDTNLGNAVTPCLCSVIGNELDGEPNQAIGYDIKYVILNEPERISKEDRFNYQMLDMLRTRCDYFLGYGNRNASQLSGESVQTHIDEMKKIWNSFSEDGKPEWLTWERIEEYEKEMTKE